MTFEELDAILDEVFDQVVGPNWGQQVPPDASNEYKHWTSDDEKALLLLRYYNFTYKEIAQVLGRTEASIHSRLNLLRGDDEK